MTHAALVAKFGDAVGPMGVPSKDPFCLVQAARWLEVCRALKAEHGFRVYLIIRFILKRQRFIHFSFKKCDFAFKICKFNSFFCSF